MRPENVNEELPPLIEFSVSFLFYSTPITMLISTGFTVLLAVLVAASPLRIRSPFAVKESHPVPRK
jgi:hypothetical protein